MKFRYFFPFFSIFLFSIGTIVGIVLSNQILRIHKITPLLVKHNGTAHYSLISIEKEPNNTFDTATPLKPGYETQGTFSSSTDIDIYSFQVDNPSNIKVTLKNVPREY